MKTYKEFITELNKFERFLANKGLQALKKSRITKKVSQRFKDAVTSLRGQEGNPFVSPRREAENILRGFQRSVPGQKGENLYRTSKGVEYYNPTKNRQINMRGSSKSKNIDLEGSANLAGHVRYKKIANNMRDQHSQIYKSPIFNKSTRYKYHPSDKLIDKNFKKNKLGNPTTENIPKGAVPEQSKQIKAKNIIKQFKRKDK